MEKRRTRIEIIYDIVKFMQDSGGKSKPTAIMYKSNLSYQLLQDYLAELVNKKFIIEKEEGNHKHYILTDKAHDFIAKYDQILDFLDAFGLDF